MTFQSTLGRQNDGFIGGHAGQLQAGRQQLFRVEVVRSVERFAELAPEWDALAAAHETPLALHGWYVAALDAQRQWDPQVVIPLIWRGERLAAAAPLMESTGGSPHRLVPIDAFTGEPDRVLYLDNDALLALADACADLGEPMLFRRFAAPTDIAETFAKRLHSHVPGMMRQMHCGSFVELGDSFEDFENQMSKSRRKTVKRKQKMMEAAGGFELTAITPREDEVEGLLARFARIEDAGWKGRAGTSLIGDPTMARFVLQVARSFARTGDAVITFLTIGGQDAASRVILQHGASWCGIKIGFDEKYARFSPGIILMHETLRMAHSRGMRRYRFLGVSEEWQNYWPHERRGDYRLATYPVALGSIGALWDDARRGAKVLFRRD